MWYYLINIIIIAGLAFFYYQRAPAKFYWIFLPLKLAAGFGLGIVYTYYYASGDTFVFFEQAKVLANLAYDDLPGLINFLYTSDPEIINIGYTWTPNLVFVKLTSVFCLITGNSYWLISLYFSFFCFAALWNLYLLLTQYFADNPLAIAIGLFLIPSFAFWSSGLSKESAAVGCIAFIISSYIKALFLQGKVTWQELIMASVALILLWKLKYFYAAVLLVSLITGSVMLYFQKKYALTGILKIGLLAGSIFLGLLVLASFTHPNFYITSILDVIVQNHDELVLKSEDFVRFYQLDPTFSSVALNVPLACFSGLFSPLIWQVHSEAAVATGFENLILFACSIWAILKFRVPKENKKLILMIIALLYIIVLAALLALSTPNFGTLMRFKVAFLPFLYILVLYNNKLVRRLSNQLFD
ncbi:MAG: hypothetical protein ACFB2Y_19880 [Fulvivirga sp.]